jgi:hypothetical protein
LGASVIREKLEARLQEVSLKLDRLRTLYNRQAEADPLRRKLREYSDEYSRIKRLLDEKR